MHKSYSELIGFAIIQQRKKGDGHYYEEHHIIPRCMGGGNSKENLVLLTISEHVEAHYLLALENKENQAYFIANLQAAHMIIFGKSKFSAQKEQEIKEWLKNEEAQKLSETIKELYSRQPRPERVGKTLHYSDRIWAIKGNRSPERLLERNLGKGYWTGYAKITCCPICSSENSESNFACCEEHKALFLEQLKIKRAEVMRQKTSASWKDNSVRKLRSNNNKKKRSQFNYCWMHDLNTEKMIPLSDVPDFEKQGWEKGRLPLTKEIKEKISNSKRKNK